jgi:hypothetical protein
MSHHILTSLDLEDLTPRQLRKVLNGVARSQLPYSKKTKEEQEEDKERANEENDKLVMMHREKKGDPKAPEVLKSDLPDADEDCKPGEDCDTEAAPAKKMKGKA